MTIFKGFSTFGLKIGSVTLEDKELAVRDLLNHFYTRKGERLGSPEFGSILPTLIFEQFTDAVLDQADEDIREIISLDPRWKLIDYQIDTTDHTLTVTIQLTYLSDFSAEELLLKYRTTEEI